MPCLALALALFPISNCYKSSSSISSCCRVSTRLSCLTLRCTETSHMLHQRRCLKHSCSEIWADLSQTVSPSKVAAKILSSVVKMEALKKSQVWEFMPSEAWLKNTTSVTITTLINTAAATISAMASVHQQASSTRGSKPNA